MWRHSRHWLSCQTTGALSPPGDLEHPCDTCWSLACWCGTWRHRAAERFSAEELDVLRHRLRRPMTENVNDDDCPSWKVLFILCVTQEQHNIGLIFLESNALKPSAVSGWSNLGAGSTRGATRGTSFPGPVGSRAERMKASTLRFSV